MFVFDQNVFDLSYVPGFGSAGAGGTNAGAHQQYEPPRTPVIGLKKTGYFRTKSVSLILHILILVSLGSTSSL